MARETAAISLSRFYTDKDSSLRVPLIFKLTFVRSQISIFSTSPYMVLGEDS